MKSALLSWQLWAVLSAGFAALTAIFAKVGVENVNSDFATFIRTIVILFALGAILASTGQWQSARQRLAPKLFVPDPFRSGNGRFLGVLFSRAKAGRRRARRTNRRA